MWRYWMEYVISTLAYLKLIESSSQLELLPVSQAPPALSSTTVSDFTEYL